MNDFQLAVTGHACTGRNQLADDDVFLQTEEWIFLALDSGFGKNAGRFLEGCGGEEGVGSKSCLCRAEEQVDALGRFLSFVFQTSVHAAVCDNVDDFAREPARIARFDDLDLTEHLVSDDFDVLIVDFNALAAVNLLTSLTM